MGEGGQATAHRGHTCGMRAGASSTAAAAWTTQSQTKPQTNRAHPCGVAGEELVVLGGAQLEGRKWGRGEATAGL